MSKIQNPKIVLLGAGRLATWFAVRFLEKKMGLVQIFNRTADAAQKLSEKTGVPWTNDFSKILPDADWYILAVRDDAVFEVAEKLAEIHPAGLVTHVSGVTSGEKLKSFFLRSGVFWPLQSFSAEKKPDWKTMPICLDAAADSDLIFLENMARKMGANPSRINDEQRAKLHVAAVFANNFTNHCLVIAEKLLGEADLSPTLLEPLVRETFEKALQISPAAAQTGPARRGDLATLEKHLLILKNDPLRQDIYRKMSESIAETRDLTTF